MVVKDISKEELKELYSKDFPLWAEINLKLLRDKAYELVDWDNLLEEIEDIGRSDLKECISYLAVILEHIYKWDNFKHLAGGETAGNSWKRSIRNARRELDILLTDYPSLRYKLPPEIDKAWRRAVKNIEIWLEDNGYNPQDFNIPQECPYKYEETINKEF